MVTIITQTDNPPSRSNINSNNINNININPTTHKQEVRHRQPVMVLLGIAVFVVMHAHAVLANPVFRVQDEIETTTTSATKQKQKPSSSLEQRSFTRRLGRNLVSAVQSDTVHHKTTAATTSTTTTATATTKKDDDDNDDKTDHDEDYDTNPNIDNPKTGYKPTYHYTSPKSADYETETTGDNKNQHNYFLRDPTASKLNSDDVFDPKIAWLASFPNSGTSFTMGLVARATNTTFASNYGIETTYGATDVPSLPIYPRHPEGPFMPDPVTSFHHRKLPYGNYVLTKTHCGGYCVNCNPKKYAYGYQNNEQLEQQQQQQEQLEQHEQQLEQSDPPPGVSFLGDCASGFAVDGKGNLVDVSYPPERVSRVVHLIRNPFHNAIARFHLERKHHSDANTTSDQQWLEDHPDNRQGMSLFCSEQNDLRWDAEHAFFESDFFVSPTTTKQQRNTKHNPSSPTEASLPNDFQAWKELANNVPCRSDFFRYIQWHTLLHQALDYLPHKVPVLTVYYEGFGDPDYDSTARSILDFLELQPVPGDTRGNIKWSEFHSRGDYDEFFGDDQKEIVQEFLETLSSFRVWGEIKHYFR